MIRSLFTAHRLARPLIQRTFCTQSRPEERVTATLIPGDGVGPELVASMEEVFRSISVPVDFEVYFMSEVHSALSAPVETVVESIVRNGLCIKGILTTPSISFTGEADTLNIRLRNTLDLYANVVNVKSIPGVKARHGPSADPPTSPLNLTIIREQTEGEYSCLEHESIPGVVESLKVVTAKKSLRIAKFAFDYATKHGRKKVTAIHKANIMKLGDGLFLRSCREISQLYPHIKFEDMIVDNCCMQMVSKPEQFDVMVMPNLYGNILVNLAAGLVGGAGLVAGEGYSKDCVVFEPGARHAYSEQAGKNVANPTAMLLCAANFLDHAGLVSHAMQIRTAVYNVLKEGIVKTKDLGGHATTKQFTAAVVMKMGKTPRIGQEQEVGRKSFTFSRRYPVFTTSYQTMKPSNTYLYLFLVSFTTFASVESKGLCKQRPCVDIDVEQDVAAELVSSTDEIFYIGIGILVVLCLLWLFLYLMLCWYKSKSLKE